MQRKDALESGSQYLPLQKKSRASKNCQFGVIGTWWKYLEYLGRYRQVLLVVDASLTPSSYSVRFPQGRYSYPNR